MGIIEQSNARFAPLSAVAGAALAAACIACALVAGAPDCALAAETSGSTAKSAAPQTAAETGANTAAGTTQQGDSLIANTLVTLQQVEIEALTETYNAAKEKAAEVNAKVQENQRELDKMQRELAAQEDRTDRSMREAYKLQHDRIGILEVLLSSQTMDEFFVQTEYLERVNSSCIKEVLKLRELEEKLAAKQKELDALKAEVDAQEKAASEALLAAQRERAARQASSGSNDGADWFATEEEFIETWAPRLDRYLAGSPLEGQGASFARSAWRYGIDPRLSAAISTIESGKGSICIRPHNAWGWGAGGDDPKANASEWATWEEAIDAHAKGLARGYGYTVTEAGAKAYCPPNAEKWHAILTSEMAQI